MTRALLLDLDDTLVVEEPAAVAAFAATASAARHVSRRNPGAHARMARSSSSSPS